MKAIKIQDQADALRRIDSLHPIFNSEAGDNIWLGTIKSFGVQNLPTELLAIVAQKMIENEGSECVIDLQPEEEVINGDVLAFEYVSESEDENLVQCKMHTSIIDRGMTLGREYTVFIPKADFEKMQKTEFRILLSEKK